MTESPHNIRHLNVSKTVVAAHLASPSQYAFLCLQPWSCTRIFSAGTAASLPHPSFLPTRTAGMSSPRARAGESSAPMASAPSGGEGGAGRGSRPARVSSRPAVSGRPASGPRSNTRTQRGVNGRTAPRARSRIGTFHHLQQQVDALLVAHQGLLEARCQIQFHRPLHRFRPGPLQRGGAIAPRPRHEHENGVRRRPRSREEIETGAVRRAVLHRCPSSPRNPSAAVAVPGRKAAHRHGGRPGRVGARRCLEGGEGVAGATIRWHGEGPVGAAGASADGKM